MNYILVGKHGRPSIRAVSSQMNEKHCVLMRKKFLTGKIRWYTYYPEDDCWFKIKEFPTITNKDRVIRWGFSGTIINATTPLVYQEAKAIDLISNKGESRIVMAANGVPVPKTSTWEHPVDITPPYIFRPTKHSRGRNFFFVKNLADEAEIAKAGFNRQTGYSSEVYEKTEEVRVYVAHRKVLMIREKPLVEGVIQANRAITHDEWRVVPTEEYSRYYSACKAAIQACDAVGAHTGGVDVMINRKNKEMPVCVCEINSAPTIKSSEYGVQRYAKYFDWLFRKDRKTWKYTHPVTGEVREFPDKGKSFFFTNAQLEE